MEIQATLSTLAEVAITLAGFSGLLFALMRDNRDTAQALFRVSAIVVACLVVVMSALLPAPLMEQGLSERVSHGVPAVILGLGFMGVGVSISIAGRRGLFTSAAPIVSLLIRGPSWLVGLALVLSPIFGWLDSMPALLAFGCLWFVTVIGAYFVLSVLWVLQEQSAVARGDE